MENKACLTVFWDLWTLDLWTYGTHIRKVNIFLCNFEAPHELRSKCKHFFFRLPNCKKIEEKKIYYHIHTPICLEGGVQEIFYKKVSKLYIFNLINRQIAPSFGCDNF